MRLAVSEFDDAHVDVGPTVVVEVLNLDVRALHFQRRDAGRLGDILELRNAIGHAAIQVKADRGRRLPRAFEMIADRNVGQPVAVHVGNADSGGRIVRAIDVPAEHVSRPRCLQKLAMPIVEHQPMFAAAVRQEDVGPAIVVHIRRGHTQSAQTDRQPHGLGNILKAEFAPVAIQRRSRLDVGRVILLAGHEIEQPVAVEVQRGQPAARVTRRARTARWGHVGELPCAVVAEQLARQGSNLVASNGAGRNVKVQPAVVIQIQKQRPAADARRAQVLLLIEPECPLLVSKQHAGLGTRIVKRPHEQIGPSVAIHVAPSRRVPANTGHVRKEPRLRTDISEDERITVRARAPGCHDGQQEDRGRQASREVAGSLCSSHLGWPFVCWTHRYFPLPNQPNKSGMTDPSHGLVQRKMEFRLRRVRE